MKQKVEAFQVLVGLVWADGRITIEEMNSLKSIAVELGLVGANYRRAVAAIIDPPDPASVAGSITDTVTRDFVFTQAVVLSLVDRDLHLDELRMLDKIGDALRIAKERQHEIRSTIEGSREWGSASPAKKTFSLRVSSNG